MSSAFQLSSAYRPYRSPTTDSSTIVAGRATRTTATSDLAGPAARERGGVAVQQSPQRPAQHEPGGHAPAGRTPRAPAPAQPEDDPGSNEDDAAATGTAYAASTRLRSGRSWSTPRGGRWGSRFWAAAIGAPLCVGADELARLRGAPGNRRRRCIQSALVVRQPQGHVVDDVGHACGVRSKAWTSDDRGDRTLERGGPRAARRAGRGHGDVRRSPDPRRHRAPRGLLQCLPLPAGSHLPHPGGDHARRSGAGQLRTRVRLHLHH